MKKLSIENFKKNGITLLSKDQVNQLNGGTGIKSIGSALETMARKQ